MTRLWPHQTAAIEAAMTAIDDSRPSGLWVMPTGCVKTVGVSVWADRPLLFFT